jgi:hypothetical protein
MKKLKPEIMTRITEHPVEVLRVAIFILLQILGRLSTSSTSNVHRNNLVRIATLYV